MDINKHNWIYGYRTKHYTRNRRILKPGTGITKDNINKMDNKTQNKDNRPVHVITTDMAEHLTLRRFGNKVGETINGFLRGIDNYCALKNHNDDYKCTLVPILLQGEAKLYYKTLTQEEKTDYEQLSHRLREKFATDVPIAYRELFKKLGQKEGENTRNYINRVITAAGYLQEYATEETLREQILDGLEPYVKTKTIVDHKADTLLDVIDHAKKVEDLQTLMTVEDSKQLGIDIWEDKEYLDKIAYKVPKELLQGSEEQEKVELKLQEKLIL